LTESYPWEPVERAANVLIFPELQSANIAYKLLWRLANCEAIGPILLAWANRPRPQAGLEVSDIVNRRRSASSTPGAGGETDRVVKGSHPGFADTIRTPQSPRDPKLGGHRHEAFAKLLLSAGLVTALLVPALALAKGWQRGQYQAARRVIEFKNKADNQWWYHGGAAAAQDVSSPSRSRAQVPVVEREQLEALMKERA